MILITFLPYAQPYSGVPFNDTDWRLEIAQHGTQVLGDKLLALQVGNEPDLYAA